MLLQKTTCVNFINILCVPFLYESLLRSFSLITVWLFIFFGKLKYISAKAARKILMKLTTAWVNFANIFCTQASKAVFVQKNFNTFMETVFDKIGLICSLIFFTNETWQHILRHLLCVCNNLFVHCTYWLVKLPQLDKELLRHKIVDMLNTGF